jgi:hypothetical protein
VHWDEAARQGVARVEGGAKAAARLRSAATLLTHARGERVTLHCEATSPWLYSLAHDSRTFAASLAAEV